MSNQKQLIVLDDLLNIIDFMRVVHSKTVKPTYINLQKLEREHTPQMRYSSYISSSMRRCGYLLKHEGRKTQWNPSKPTPDVYDAATVLKYAMTWSRKKIDPIANSHIGALIRAHTSNTAKSNRSLPASVSIKQISDEMLATELGNRGYTVKPPQPKITIAVTGPVKSGKSTIIRRIKEMLDSQQIDVLRGKIIHFEEFNDRGFRHTIDWK